MTPLSFSHKEIVRFWSMVEKGEDCWLWQGAVDSISQRGIFTYRGKNCYAYRCSWIIHFGSIPAEVKVCHKCDVPRCVNPDHLFLGTQKDNMQDCLAKGRSTHLQHPECARRGNTHPSAILNEDKVFRLRRIRLKGVSVYRMARFLGLNRRSLLAAMTGENWAHVPFPAHEKDELINHY